MNELAPLWRKSSRSGEGECVEVATLPDGRIAMRDSKHPDGPMLIVSGRAMREFLDGVRAGEFDQIP